MTEPSKGTVVGLICVPSTQTLTKKAGTPSGQSSRPVVHQFQPSAVLVARSMATNSVLLTSRTLQPQVNAKAVFTLKPVRKSGRVQQTKKCQDKDGLATSGTLRSKFGPRTYTRVKNSGGCIINPVQTVTIEDDSQTSTSTSIQKSPTRPLRACRMKPVETAEIDLDEDEVYESDSDDDGKMRPTPRPNRVVNRTIKKTRAHLSDSVEVIIPDVITPKKRSRGPKIDKTKQKSSKCQVFFCDKCDKVYDQYSELVYHLRRHTGEKPFVCTWPGCKKAFSASNARVRHLRIHTGERPYACPFPECGRRFTYWKDLKLHKFRHTGEKPHKCDWEGCNSRFFRKDDLRHHRYTHTGERPYKCPVPGCGAAFTQKSPLNLHVRRIHKIETPIKVSVESAKSSEAVAMATTSMTAASTTCIPVEAAPTLASSNVTDTDFATSISQNLQAPSLCSLQPNQHSLENDMLTIVPNNLNSESVAQISYASSMQTTSAMTIQATSAPEACTTTHCVHYPAPCQSVSYDSPSLSSIAVPLSPSRHDEDLVRPPETLKTIITNIQSSNFRTYSKLPRTEQIEASLNVSSTGVHEQEKQKEIETVTIDDNDRNDQDNSQKALVKPIRRRANYRLKVHPIGENNLRTTHNIIKVASGRKQQLKSDEAVRLKRTSKRTIAVQTMRRRGRKCNSDKINQDGLFECDFCQRVFKAKHDRDCHRMTHTGEKPRACEWPSCNYRCITKSKLTRHMRKHTGEKNYPCEWPECGKKFGTSRHLKEHSRCHTGEKPFKCDYPGCDKWFSRKDHIKNHRFTHTGERPRKCPFPGCEAAFIQLSPLKKHMELHKRDGANVPNRTRKKKQFDQQPTETLAQNNAIPSEPNVTAPSGGTVPDAPQERLSVNQSGLPEFGTENASQNFGFGGYENVMQPPLHLDYDKGYYFY